MRLAPFQYTPDYDRIYKIIAVVWIVGVTDVYLKQLEVHGFKSFAEKIELNFGNTINAIVGPNGSGKSNVSDAIRWVLGEQSVKALRGSRMEDVIFAGSDSKKALGFAEVSLCIDNCDRKIPVDFTEIHIMRRMYRSGESEYFINKTNCRLKDIHELFMDTGIGRDGYSIIGQGRIDEILSNKSEDRRLVFEEAAGIVKYKTRKQEAEKKLEQTKQNILRVTDIIEEIEYQLEPMAMQAEVAKRYRDIIQELKSLEINVMLNSIDRGRSRLEAIKKEAEGIKELIEAKQTLSLQLEQKQDELKKALALLEVEIDRLSETIFEKKNLSEKHEGECNLLQEKINNLNQNTARLNKRDQELREEVEKSRNSAAQNREKQQQLSRSYMELNAAVLERSQAFETNFNIISETEEKLNEKQQQYITLINQHSEFRSKINSTNVFVDNLVKRKNQVEGDINLLELQCADKEKLQKRSLEELADFERKLADAGKQIEAIKAEKQAVEVEIQQADDRTSQLKSEREGTASRLKVLEDMEKDHGGYSRSVKVLLNEHAGITKGFCGVIGEMVKVPPEYVTAVEIALGSSVQSIVTETEEDAKLLIEYLKEHKVGRATFLPVSSVSPRYFNEREKKLFGMKGFIGIASDLIRFDAKYNGIMLNLLGRIAVVEDMDAAIRIARAAGYEFRIVTLAGEIINAGGSITGGSLHAASSSVLSRKNEIESLKTQYEEKSAALAESSRQLETLKQKAADLTADIGFKTDLHHSLLIDINNYKNRCDNILNDLQIISDRIGLNRKDLAELNKELGDTGSIIDENTKKAEAVNREKTAAEEDIAALQEQMKQFKEVRDDYNEEITDLKIKLASVEHNKRTAENLVRDLEQRIQELLQEIEGNEQEILREASEADTLTARLQEKRGAMGVLRAEIDEMQQQHNVKEGSRLEMLQALQHVEESMKECSKDAANLQGDLHRIEMQFARIEVELDNVEMKLLETYDMSYVKAMEYKDDKLNLSWAGKRCEELKGEIREMGTVNVNAVEEYEKLQERYLFLKNQVDDLTRARDNLIGVIQEITENMKVQFITEFNKINENFGQVFQKLFGGGFAQLVISDEENVLESGIEIIAKPPGKKLQNLMLLSGGERALTATALLFGILKMKPAPFCVLDEIDAALDDANVDRYAQFLVEFSATTQFIIVTHRKGTMEAADCLYGVSMEDSGVSKLISVKLEDKVS